MHMSLLSCSSGVARVELYLQATTVPVLRAIALQLQPSLFPVNFWPFLGVCVLMPLGETVSGILGLSQCARPSLGGFVCMLPGEAVVGMSRL